jgi:CheY-like chemotaxis protein
MDLIMPGLNGIDTIARIRSLEHTMRETQTHFEPCCIIVVSASAFEQDQKRSEAAGCNDFLAKPFRTEKLLSVLGDNLNLQWCYHTSTLGTSEELQQAQITIETTEHLSLRLLAEQVECLYDLAMSGDIDGILDYAEQLKTSDKQFIPLADRIISLAEVYDINKIRDIARYYQETKK